MLNKQPGVWCLEQAEQAGGSEEGWNGVEEAEREEEDFFHKQKRASTVWGKSRKGEVSQAGEEERVEGLP